MLYTSNDVPICYAVRIMLLCCYAVIWIPPPQCSAVFVKWCISAPASAEAGHKCIIASPGCQPASLLFSNNKPLLTLVLEEGIFFFEKIKGQSQEAACLIAFLLEQAFVGTPYKVCLLKSPPQLGRQTCVEVWMSAFWSTLLALSGALYVRIRDWLGNFWWICLRHF